MVALEDYKRNIACGTSVANQLVVGRELQIKTNRHYLISVAQVLLLCSHQEIALRGHRESEDSDNRGNFLELLHLLGKHDTVVMEYVKEGPRNATYTSLEIQNSLLKFMASMVRKQICLSVQRAGPFTILADESKDISKQEQMSISLRYVDISSGSVQEHFLTFVNVISLTADSLATYIQRT